MAKVLPTSIKLDPDLREKLDFLIWSTGISAVDFFGHLAKSYFDQYPVDPDLFKQYRAYKQLQESIQAGLKDQGLDVVHSGPLQMKDGKVIISGAIRTPKKSARKKKGS